MFSPEQLAQMRAAQERWNDETLAPTLQKTPERPALFSTISSEPIQRLYTPLDIADTDYQKDISFPGEFPYTRGIHPTGYRGKLWTMRMFAGFGTAEETNARFKYLLSQGQTGLSTAFDMPTLYGRDTDHPLVEGEFGKCGVAVTSLADMDILFDGIPLDQVTTSMTINSPAAIIWAMYIAAAEKRGISRAKLGGTLQNDILKEYAAQNEYIFPIAPSMRLVVDTIEFAAQHMPKWNPVSVSGYHIREAGSTAAQELAFTLGDGIAYVKACLKRGLNIDDFAPRISYFFNAHNDFFEEIAKYRAARRVWARQMRDVYGAKNPRSWWMRFHTQTAGVSLTAQQPENNIVRVAIQALAAVIGGTQSLHTDAMDEALALPSEKAVTIALRTQQIIAEESGVTNTIDPLAGSYFVEALTNRMEAECLDYFRRIEEQGGMEAALEKGWIQQQIADSSYRFQQEVDSGQRGFVGVNKYTVDDPIEIPILQMDPDGENKHMARLNKVRNERDQVRWAEAMDNLRQAAQGEHNLMEPILAAVNAYATLGEMCDVLREVFGVYQEVMIV
ncbi:MAG TPA: methylmalonyl-CoA mutase [Herpetosiphon sp.]|uniref:Methylmalonyl-CoA mutase, large subunit n=1 Tax=Herpetosiphon aurantiacus (strain ATCC 23779 / DSM 785 / 114-95) TaxID=316274 RepID=A9B2V3_HERA2|nr:methylmalonyl-CoA mutase family protein [Herpetosiphon sp.]ABX06016.1 methylmalonyl-CoA mutase, large subunit [Herpetosiphon aurantiacus DSM 785]HBW49478.1 methylmalonyl-CoA mutase [Herpetosiphon sp.]